MKKLKIVCLGDSLTEAYNIEYENCWSYLLQNQLSVETINCGISGDTTAGMLARFQTQVIDANPSHVIITGGTNDLWFNLSAELIISNILAMSRHAKHNDIIPIIGIPTPFFPKPGIIEDYLFLESTALKKRIEDYQKKLILFAEDDDLIYINFSLNMKPDLFFEDGIHPNENGHALMSNIAFEVINRL